LGGGGGGGLGLAPSDLDRLENIARDSIRNAQGPVKRRRVFLSFQVEDLDSVNLFRGQAKNENSELDFIDFSLRAPFNSENAEYIRRGIRDRISASSTTIVLIGKNTHNSEWVDWEIRESIKQNKKVIVVTLDNDSPSKLPKVCKEAGITSVSWNHEEIKRALEEP
jgi:hypothetical protein